jgi:bacterioferritin-associated ferredoxin
MMLELTFTFIKAILDSMIVCLCKGITDRTIRTLVREGACSISEVGRACDAGRTCGGCRPTINHLVETETKQRKSPRGMMQGHER